MSGQCPDIPGALWCVKQVRGHSEESVNSEDSHFKYLAIAFLTLSCFGHRPVLIILRTVFNDMSHVIHIIICSRIFLGKILVFIWCLFGRVFA
jgi:hypothetical protein